MSNMYSMPVIFVNASAVGFYGMSNSVIFTEDTKTPAKDFLADVVSKWEDAALDAEDFGIRTVRTRFGIILDGNNGALSMMDKQIGRASCRERVWRSEMEAEEKKNR